MTNSAKKFKATKIEDGIYEYRGYTIERNDDVPSGYWGRWEANFGRISATTMRECKEIIDAKFN